MRSHIINYIFIEKIIYLIVRDEQLEKHGIQMSKSITE